MKNNKLKFVSLSSLAILPFLSLVSITSFSNQSSLINSNSYKKIVQDDSSSSSTVSISNITLGAFYETSSTNALPITYQNQKNKGLFFQAANTDNNLYLYFSLIIDFNKSDITSVTNLITVSLDLDSNLNKNYYQSYWVPNENKINQLFTNQINTVLSSAPFTPNQSFSISNLDIEFTYTSDSSYTINLGNYQITNNYLSDLNKEKNNNNDLNNQLKNSISQNNDLNTIKIILAVIVAILFIVILILVFVMIRSRRRMKN